MDGGIISTTFAIINQQINLANRAAVSPRRA